MVVLFEKKDVNLTKMVQTLKFSVQSGCGFTAASLVIGEEDLRFTLTYSSNWMGQKRVDVVRQGTVVHTTPFMTTLLVDPLPEEQEARAAFQLIHLGASFDFDVYDAEYDDMLCGNCRVNAESGAKYDAILLKGSGIMNLAVSAVPARMLMGNVATM